MEKDIEIDGLSIHYEETGNPEGSPVIVMHGWGCDHTTVASISNILAEKMRVISVDLPGHGKSGEPQSIWGTLDFAKAMEGFIKKLDITRPALIGHSFGGRTAIMMASMGDYGKILLVDSAGVKPKRNLGYYRKIYTFKLIRFCLSLIFGKDNKIIEKYRKKRGSADYAKASPMMRQIMSKAVNEDLKGIMPNIKSPVLLVWGKEDTATPLSDAKKMEKLIPDAGLVAFDGCGHYSFLDNPFGFKAVVKEFFKKELN